MSQVCSNEVCGFVFVHCTQVNIFLINRIVLFARAVSHYAIMYVCMYAVLERKGTMLFHFLSKIIIIPIMFF